MIETPCTRNCHLKQDDICIGCWRTLDEIKEWIYLSDEERLIVLDNITERKLLG